MMSTTVKYKLSKRAQNDLESIWRYTLETWSRNQANNYVMGLLDACSLIAEAPESVGRPYDHVKEGYRKYLWGHHVIFYRLDEDGRTFVVRVLHERMDFDRHL